MNKVQPFESLLLDREPDIVAVTETWLSASVSSHEVAPPNYVLVRKDRQSRGGGVALAIKKSIPLVVLPEVPDAEAVFCKINTKSTSIVVGCIYRSPGCGHECISAIQEYLQQHTGKCRVILMGDFNLPDFNWATMQYTTKASEALVDMMLSFNLRQIVECPTRVQGECRSVLDLILLSNNFLLEQAQVEVIEGISDHRMPMCILPLDCPIPMQTVAQTIINFEEANDAPIQTYLAHEFSAFSELASDPLSDVNDVWLRFKAIVSHCVTNFIPVKLKKPLKNNPWITREVIHAKRQLKRIRKANKAAGTNPSNASRLALAAKHFKQKSREAKSHYFNTVLPSFLKNNPHRFWNHFRQKSILTTQLSSSEKKDKANRYNEFFRSVFTEDNGVTPDLDLRPGSTIDPLVITDAGVLNLLLSLDTKKACGPDNIPNQFFKRYAQWCSRYLGIIFRKSLSTSKLPKDWKIAKIIPIHKSGDKSIESNFRPISLTSTACKLLEHIILKHLTVFLEREGILSNNQHGFRQGLSTITQLTEVIHDLALGINNHRQTDVILLDLSKAFDCVCHAKLITKLTNLIGDGEITAWVRDFLFNRSQFVVFEHFASETVPVTSGVPQGSVLGPLLFLMYINDITNNIDSKIKLFADDCIIYREINIEQDHHSLQKSLNTIAEWCSDWQMTINVKKSACMTITRKKQPSNFRYNINGAALTNVQRHKYLGLTITSDLRWDEHIEHVTSSAMQKLFFLRRSLQLAPTSTKLLAYKTFIRPILEYGNTVWFPHTVTNIKKIEKVQRKAIRFIHNKFKRDDSPTTLLAVSGLPTLETRAKHARLKFLYQLLHNYYKIDVSKYVKYSQARATRHKHTNTLLEYQCNNDAFKYSFFPVAIHEWNLLTPFTTNAESLCDFLSRIENDAP